MRSGQVCPEDRDRRAGLDLPGYAAFCAKLRDTSFNDRFRAGEGDWILGIRRLTEGVNIPRLRVGIHVSFMCTTRQAFEQFSARMERLLMGLPPEDQAGCIIIPKHPRFEKYAREYEEERKTAEELRKMATCECPACGATIPSLASNCPFCEAETPGARARAPWQVSDGNIIPTDITQTAYLASFIYRSQSLTVSEAEVLAAAYDLRCKRAGLPETGALSVERKAFRELRLQLQVSGVARSSKA